MPLARKFNTKTMYKKQTEGLPDRRLYIVCELYFGGSCRLIDIALHRKKIIIIIQSPEHFTD